MGKRKFFCHDTDLKNNLDAVRELSEIKMEDLPFGEEIEVILPVQDIPRNGDSYEVKDRCDIVVGETYIVTFEGVEYTCVAKTFEQEGMITAMLGNTYFLNSEAEDSAEEPFAYVSVPDEMVEMMGVAGIVWEDTSLPETVQFGIAKKTVQKMSGKYVEGMGYSESVVLLEESNAEAYEHPALGKAWLIEEAPKLEAGMIYTVTYNGVEYKCMCGAAPSGFSNDPDAVAMGNFSVAGGTDTGEPFAMLISYAQNRVDVIDLSGASEVKVKIAKETIHPIDKKYVSKTEFYIMSDHSRGDTHIKLWDRGGKYNGARITRAEALAAGDNVCIRVIDYSDYDRVIYTAYPVVKQDYGDWVTFGFFDDSGNYNACVTAGFPEGPM